MAHSILRIDASPRKTGSITRDLVDQVISKLGATSVVARDLSDGIPLISEAWVEASFTPASDRTAAQEEALSASNALVAEIFAADTLVIGVPIYNFGVPAALKAWIDMVARSGVTFQYSAEGPRGLVEGKRAILVVASGGTKIGSDIDFAVGYLEHVLSFIGITDIEIIAADQMVLDADKSLAQAKTSIDALAA
ncbi:MAG: NAD(P)H-dependent oxidoreductase [Pseudomonadota bacterium]